MFAIRTIMLPMKKIIRIHSSQCAMLLPNSVMQHDTSRPPSNKDCTIKGKQLYNMLLDMEGTPPLNIAMPLSLCNHSAVV